MAGGACRICRELGHQSRLCPPCETRVWFIQPGQSNGFTSPPIIGGALSVGDGSLDDPIKVKHDPLYASISRSKVEALGIVCICAISL